MNAKHTWLFVSTVNSCFLLLRVCICAQHTHTSKHTSHKLRMGPRVREYIICNRTYALILWVWCFWIFHFACKSNELRFGCNIELIYWVAYKTNHTSLTHTHIHKRYYATRALIRWKIPKWKCVIYEDTQTEKPNRGFSIVLLVWWLDASSFRYCLLVLFFCHFHFFSFIHHHIIIIIVVILIVVVVIIFSV